MPLFHLFYSIKKIFDNCTKLRGLNLVLSESLKFWLDASDGAEWALGMVRWGGLGGGG